MTPSEATDLATRQYRKVVAAALGVSSSLIDKHASGVARCPVAWVVDTTLALREAGAPNADYLVHYLNERTGFLPPQRADGAVDGITPEVAAIETLAVIVAIAAPLVNGRRHGPRRAPPSSVALTETRRATAANGGSNQDNR